MYRVGVRAFSTSFQRQGKESFQFLVVGAGAGGLSISSTFCRKYPHATAIIEPSEVSFFCCSYDISPSSFERNIFEENVRRKTPPHTWGGLIANWASNVFTATVFRTSQTLMLSRTKNIFPVFLGRCLQVILYCLS